MTSLRTRRIRAVISSLCEGAGVGAVLASREAPPWSRTRVLTAAAAAAVVLVDQAATDVPRVVREVSTHGEVGPLPPHERDALLRAGGRAVGAGLVVQLLDRPVRRLLVRRGVRHPHRWVGATAGLLQVAAVAPVYWRAAADAARQEAERDAAIEAELQRMAAGG